MPLRATHARFFGVFSQVSIIKRITAIVSVCWSETDLEENGRFPPPAQFYCTPVDDFAWDVLICLKSPNYQLV
jgi:hypothetical protein